MTTSLRVVVGITSRSWGGNEKWAADAARGLRDRGHAVTVMWSYEPVRRELERRRLRSRRVRLWGDLNPIGFGSLTALLRRERPDVLLLTKQREYWMGGHAARLAGRPLVVLRMGLRRSLRDDHKRRTVFGKLADLIIVNSSCVRDTLLESPWVDPARVAVLLNSVALDSIPEGEGRRLIESLGVPRGAPVVCGAGRLTRQKGLDVLIDSFALVLGRVPSARLLIIGEGGQREALERAASDAGVAGSVLFAGHREDVRELLSGVDVYALSSRNEGMANTLLEAMSVGAPIVATDVSGTAEAVTNEKEALVVPPEDPVALAEATLRLLDNRDLASSLGSAARHRAESKFGRERMLEELEGLLVEGIARKRRDASAPRP